MRRHQSGDKVTDALFFMAGSIRTSLIGNQLTRSVPGDGEERGSA